MGFYIGNTYLKHGLMLAPMAGVTDRTFRKICKEHGAEYTVSEMVSAKALCYEQASKKKNIDSPTAKLAAVFDEDMPLAIQIFGSEPYFMAEAAKMISSGEYKGCLSKTIPSAIDINMGCPVKKITSNGEGSALMKDPILAGKIASEVCKSVNIPVTVKIRAGWDQNSKNAVELAKILEDAGVKAICVHARTREQLYNPGIDIDIIKDVKKSVSIPVIGNGDVFSAKDAQFMIEYTGCDGIMIGRGAMGNPWIFEEITHSLENRDYVAPTVKEKTKLALYQLYRMIEEHGEHVGIAQAKKHVAWYISGMKGCAAARNKIMTASCANDISFILNELLEMQNA